MDFAEKLKKIRNDEDLSQEELAEKIGVSRQAITKWETGRGMPDIENMVILAEIFKTTIDDLLDRSIKEIRNSKVNQSETIYDINGKKHFDIHLGSVHTVNLDTGPGEKLLISVKSPENIHAAELYKLKLDENKEVLDIDAIRNEKISRHDAAKLLSVHITLPQDCMSSCEIEADAQDLNIRHFVCERLEYDGDADQIVIEDTQGNIDLTGSNDYRIFLNDYHGHLDIRQFKSTCRLHVKEDALPQVENRGRFSKVYYRRNGEYTDPPAPTSTEDKITLSGFKSELLIDLG